MASFLEDGLPNDRDLKIARDRYADLLASQNSKERDWQALFTEHPYVLSLGLPLKLSPRDIHPCARPGVSEADFHIYPDDETQGNTSYGVIELKRPDSRIVTVPRKDVILLSRDAQTAAQQAAKDADHVRAKLLHRPDHSLIIGNQIHLFVIMGLSVAWRRELELEFVHRQLETQLPAGLQIIPYDVLYKRFSRSVPPDTHLLVPAIPVTEADLQLDPKVVPPESVTVPVEISRFALNGDHALKIAAKLGAEIRSGRTHDMAIFRDQGKEIARFGIRRGRKDLGHDFIPRQLHMTARQAQTFVSCQLSKDEYLRILNDKDLLR